MKGYKATDENLKCRGFQFEIGKWYEHEGELIECQSGFHFCEQPSGPWAYYSDPNTRIFEIEADDVLDVPFVPGADMKRVARRIRLVKEITPTKETNSNTGNWNTGNWNTGNRNTGNSNTGDRNTGNSNTGNCNTGDRNTGNWNTGNRNTGDSNTGNRNTGNSNTGNWNTGDSNTGNWNTGNRNTGDSNTGNWNTGNCNTGNWNTGNWNTGNWNTGNSNTGNWNTGDYSSGFFCAEEVKVISFDVQTKLTRDKFFDKYPECFALGDALQKEDPIDFKLYKRIPGITKGKLKALHEKHLEAKKKK